jgi:RNA processing factor Prp31
MKKIMLLLTFVISTQVFSDLKNDLNKNIESLMQKVIEWRHDIHQFPELSNREYRTSKK